ncbi:alpha-ribazole phosphatase family protein [Chryseobacterium sp. MEBOG06]|uniref:alpha-ribazole phosphatase family protein n=1 Tax=unclassified Chryseobacterium TaxID=2593645 RepID=UPI001F2BD97D|nr:MULTISPECIES: alpha-ribazole phosphatase family protein [unclassified Chryseobacterium]UKB85243.1 alpha-ribazole phosphatase family protein [Chryseobacterium sp. MEBOG06]
MEIHLIRHTAVENPENLCYGFSDIPLRKNYQEDFKRILLDDDYDFVISSPSLRCHLLADHFQFEYTTDERIREMNFGNWEMKKWTDIPEEEINPWYQDFVNVKAAGGENLLEMQTRVLSFWNELILKKDTDKVLIVSHAGVIRLILQAVLQFPLEKMFSIQIDYGKKVLLNRHKNLMSIKNINV